MRVQEPIPALQRLCHTHTKSFPRPAGCHPSRGALELPARMCTEDTSSPPRAPAGLGAFSPFDETPRRISVDTRRPTFQASPDPANETQPLSSLPSQPRWLWPCGRRGHWRSLCPESLLARAPVISFYGPPPVLGARRAALPDALACFYATAIKQMEGSTADHESPPLERRLTSHAEQSILTSIVAAVSLIALAMVIAQTNISRSPRLKILQAMGLWLCAILLLVASIWRHFFERRKYRVTRTDWLFYISFFFILLVLLLSVLSIATSFLPLPAHDRLAGSGGELQDFSTSK